ncbi:hypothetical protein H2200_007355 [Cladophialophora chaetospira]|uniref:Uncharacterized protein n=1 Tax=Cladophialophora chaetospira TaxID=386627 RepID=A0AA39CHF8_9EURO|nr:hypothetical protein H2200_007355 [Cladophialophora chaetospira]
MSWENPFRYRRDEDQIPTIQQILHTSYGGGWASLVPVKAEDGTFPIVRTYANFISHSDVSYYTILYAGLFHHTFQRHGLDWIRALYPLWFELKSKAFTALQLEIDALGSQSPSDELLSAVLTLSVQEPNPEALQVPPIKYPESPLARFQLLRSVGYLKPEPTHLKALYYLVSRRGGIHNVKSFGIINTLALADLIAATCSITAPVFPCIWKVPGHLEAGSSESGNRSLREDFGTWLRYMPILQGPSFQPFMDLIPDLQNVTIAVERLVNPQETELDIGDVISYANLTHYRTLKLFNQEPSLSINLPALPVPSLEPPQATSAGTNSAPFLEILRLTTLIYSNLVIFPLAVASGVRFTLATRIQRLLWKPEFRRLQDPYLDFWVVAMACIACLPHKLGTPEAVLLLQRLENLTKVSYAGKDGLQTFIEIMKGHLWWDHVCSAYIREIWQHLYPE